MFHIVFDSRGAELLSSAMDMDEALDGEIIQIRDDFAVGPIGIYFLKPDGMNEKNGGQAYRKEKGFPQKIRSAGDSDSDTIRKIVQRMEEEEFDQIWIWMAPNAKDVCGYYWLVASSKNFPAGSFCSV